MTFASASDTPRSDVATRWLQLVLVLSLAVNLLIAGAVLGGAWVLRHGAGPLGSMRQLAAGSMVGPPLARFIATLPPERRAELHDVIVQYQGAAADFNKSMAAARHEAADVLLAAPFDRAKFEAAAKRVFDAELAGRTAMIPVTGNIVEHLNGGERESFLRLLRWQQGIANDAKAAETAPGTKAP